MDNLTWKQNYALVTRQQQDQPTMPVIVSQINIIINNL